MLIDQLKHKVPNLSIIDGSDKMVKDSICFFVDEPAIPFIKEGAKSLYSKNKFFSPRMPSHMPFDNVMLQFRDGTCVWLVENVLDKFSGEREIITHSFAGCRNRWIHKLEQTSDILFPSPGWCTFISDLTNAVFFDKGLMEEDWFKSLSEEEQGARKLFPIAIVFRFLSFLSCKNIRTKTVIPEDKKNLKRVRAGKPPFNSYHVLEIQSGKHVEGGNKQNLWSNRVHFCRGHIRTYTEDKPLFGKITGNIWCPPHARGNKKNGIVHKDYSINLN